jgi:hypothetical protein
MKNRMKIDAAVPARGSSISKHPHDGSEEAHRSDRRHHKHPTLYCLHDAAINPIRDSSTAAAVFLPFPFRCVVVDRALDDLSVFVLYPVS